MGKLHFKLDFEGTTNILRENWASGRYEWCYEFITNLGLSREVGEEVIAGKSKLAQFPGGIDGVEGMVVDDNWTPAGKYLYYPTRQDMVALAEKGRRAEVEIPRLQDMAISLIMRLRYAGPANGVDIHELETMLLSLPEEARERNKIEERYMTPGEHDIGQGKILVVGDNDNGWERLDTAGAADRRLEMLGLPSLAGFIDKLTSLDNKSLPEPDDDYTSANGYITPDGEFYPCEWLEHQWLAEEIESQLDVDEWELVKVFKSQIGDRLGYDYGYAPNGERYTMTSRQYSTLQYWCAKHGVQFNESR